MPPKRGRPKKTAKTTKKTAKKPPKQPKKPKKTPKITKKTAKKGVKVVKIPVKRKRNYKPDPVGLFTIPKFDRTGAESIEFKKSGKSIKTLKFFNPKDNFNEFNIVEFTNIKRKGLKTTGRYDNTQLSIAYQYEDGTWGGTKFFNMDEQVTLNRRYGDEVPTDRIVGFVIKFK